MVAVDLVQLLSYLGTAAVGAIALYYAVKTRLGQAAALVDKFLSPTSPVRVALDDLNVALVDNTITEEEFRTLFVDFKNLYLGVKKAVDTKSVAPLK